MRIPSIAALACDSSEEAEATLPLDASATLVLPDVGVGVGVLGDGVGKGVGNGVGNGVGKGVGNGVAVGKGVGTGVGGGVVVPPGVKQLP